MTEKYIKQKMLRYKKVEEDKQFNNNKIKQTFVNQNTCFNEFVRKIILCLKL